ncbi:MAG: GNAT family N-acetyltransferase, partial [Flavobacteriales bacterium]
VFFGRNAPACRTVIHAAYDGIYFSTFRVNYDQKIRQLEMTLSDPLEQVWIARVERVPVGFSSVHMSYVPSMFNSQFQATLGDIYVAPEFRSVGIGKRLLDEAMSWAHIREAHSLALNVHHHNAEAIRFYTTHGFEEKFKVMTIPL